MEAHVVRRETPGAGTTRTGESSVRTCLVCRARRRPEELLRLREAHGGVRFEGARSGRGAWVCVSRTCLERLEGRGLSRALRRPLALCADEPCIQTAARVARERVLALLGLARRQGALVIGQDRVARERVALVVVALDASPRSRAAAGESGRVFGTSAELSRATGLAGVAVLGVAAGSLAQQAAYWLTVWYESRSRVAGERGV